MSGQWVDLPTAAELLGTTTEAVRKRASRGTLRSDRHDGRVVVWVDDGRTEGGRETQVDGGPLVESLQDQVRYLRDQLDAERRANEENRRLLAALIQRVPELEAPEAPQGPENGWEGAEPRSNGGSPQGTAEGRQEGPEERASWWRRFFGFD